MVVWKWPAPLYGSGAFDHSMPAGARLLTVQHQGDEPQLWAVVDPAAAQVTRSFLWVGTGIAFEARADDVHVGTLLFNDDRFVFHLFARAER